MVVFITGRLLLRGLEGTFIFIEGITVSGSLGDIFIGAFRLDEGVREKTGFANGVEFDAALFLFLGVSGRGLSVIVVVSKAACTWVYTLEKSLGFRHAAA
jgi:hypothetical protein